MAAFERRDTRDWPEREFGKVEVRSDGQRTKIGGYAAKFNARSKNLGGFVEQISNGFFNKSRSDGWPDVICRYNHHDNMLLGTTAAGTLDLQLDDIGLFYVADPPESMRNVVEWVQRGDVRKSSFAFRTYQDDWTLSDEGYPLRTLVSGALVDVAPVVTPAYDDTSADARALEKATPGLESLAAKMATDVAEVRSLAQQDELRKFFVRTDKPAPLKPKLFGPAAAAALLARKADPWS